jgi:hypothetical protein
MNPDLLHIVIDCHECPSYSVALMPTEVVPEQGPFVVEGACECGTKHSMVVRLSKVKSEKPRSASPAPRVGAESEEAKR